MSLQDDTEAGNTNLVGRNSRGSSGSSEIEYVGSSKSVETREMVSELANIGHVSPLEALKYSKETNVTISRKLEMLCIWLVSIDHTYGIKDLEVRREALVYRTN